MMSNKTRTSIISSLCSDDKKDENSNNKRETVDQDEEDQNGKDSSTVFTTIVPLINTDSITNVQKGKLQVLSTTC